MLKKEFKYFQSNRKNLRKKYLGKTLVIKDESIVGVYDSEEEALREASKKFKLGTFLIQSLTGKDEDFTQRFHSRAFVR